MRYLFCTNTPAHVHTYKHVIGRLEARGHEVCVLARDYACTVELCAAYQLPYEVYGSHGTEEYAIRQFALELPDQFARIVAKARRFDPDVVFGRGPYAACAGLVSGAQTILLLDSEPGTLAHTVSARVADLVLTPASFVGSLGAVHHTFDGFKESAYLHPDTFDPDSSVRNELGVATDECYAILRFNAFDAFHDVGEDGLTRDQQRALVDAIATEATVFVSHEGTGLELDSLDARPYDLAPARIHDALAEASLLVAETGTMITEAALLGTPAVGCGAFAHWDFGEFAALEDAGLVVVTGDFEATVAAAHDLLADDLARARWQRRRDEFVADQVDLTSLLVSVALDPEGAPTLDHVRNRESARVDGHAKGIRS